MKMTLTTGDMLDIFRSWDRDYYSWYGMDAILNYYDEIDENTELDVIGVCGDCTEYGPCSPIDIGFENLISDYGYKYPVDEWLENNDLSKDEFNEDQYLDDLIEKLENETTVLRADNGDVIVFAF